MSFEMQVVSNTPPIADDDLDRVAKQFLEQIGYISKGSDPQIPYKIFADYFLKHPTKPWFVEEIAVKLDISKPTVYRHLNKLKGFDILEEVQVFDESTQQHKKAYRIRYGNFQKAWNFVEAHIKVAVENYSKTVEHLQRLLEQQEKWYTMAKKEDLKLIEGSRYKIISIGGRDAIFETEGIFTGYASIGIDEGGIVIEISKKEDTIKQGVTRIIPLHAILAIDVLDVKHNEQSEDIKETNHHYYG